MATNRAWGDMYEKYWSVLEDVKRKPGDEINAAEEFTEFFATYDDVVCLRCRTLAAWDAHDKLRDQFHKRMADRTACEYLRELTGDASRKPCTGPPDEDIGLFPAPSKKKKAL